MEKRKRMLLLVNPCSGKKAAQSVLLPIVDQLNKSGWRVEVRITQSRGDASKIASMAEGYFDRITAVGGDGTLNELISGVAGWNTLPDIGYIPLGTTNDFASTLGFPKDPVEAAKTAAEGEPFVCDIGRFGERYFAYIAAFGAFTDVAYSTDQQAKNIFGRLAYLFQGALELSSLQQGQHMKVVTEKETIEDEFIFGGVSNSLSIGGFKGLLTGDIYLDDGWLELLLVRQPKSMVQLHELVTALLSQQFTGANGIYFLKVRSAEFICDHPVAWTLDGEDGGERERVTVQCVPGAVSFSVGARDPELSLGDLTEPVAGA